MSDFLSYFSGVKGNIVSGNVNVPFLISKETDGISKISTLPFYYSDEFFLKSACSYNHRLAIMSLGMSMSAFTENISGDRSVRSLLTAIGCDCKYIQTKKFDTAVPTDDSCAYAFGAKKLPDGSYLVPVVIRSHKYGGEWVSNAHVFDESCPDFAFGFKTAADKVYDALSTYISRLELSGKRVKIWISGFSRGGAVSNLIGARLSLESGIEKDNIFVYTFATPNTVSKDTLVFTDNIFNIISETDSVPRMPPANWGFCRYGTDLYLPCQSRCGEQVYSVRIEAMRNAFAEICEKNGIGAVEYSPLDEQEKALDLLFDYIDDLVPDPETYAKNGYQSLLMDYMAGVVSKSKTEFKRFVYFMLPGRKELADEFCAIFEQWNKMSRSEKAQKITLLNIKVTGKVTKQLIAGDSPASDIISTALRILVNYAAKLTATKVTRGGQDYYYEQLTKLLAGTFSMGSDSPLLMQHWSEVYLAWLLSGDERELYSTLAYPRKELK